MASVAASSISVPARSRSVPQRVQQAVAHNPGLRSISFTNQRRGFQSVRLQTASHRFRVSCSAKPETVEKVITIVKKQLALSEDTPVSGESKFSQLGADSLDTVEIVMGLEEEFRITVDEGSAQEIATIQDAADMIEKLASDKSA